MTLHLDLAIVDPQAVIYDAAERAVLVGPGVALVCARNPSKLSVRNTVEALAALRAQVLAATRANGHRPPRHEPACRPDPRVGFELDLAWVPRSAIHLDTACRIHVGPQLLLRADPFSCVLVLLALDRAAAIAGDAVGKLTGGRAPGGAS